MRVVFCEIKKIFRPVRFLAVLAFTAVFFAVYIYGFYIDQLSVNGVRQEIMVRQYLHEKYGAVLSVAERAEAEKEATTYFENYISKLVKDDKIMQAAGAVDHDSIAALLKRAEYANLIEQGITKFEEYGLEKYDPKKDYTLTDAEKKAVAHFNSLDDGSAVFDMDLITDVKSYFSQYDRMHDGTDHIREYISNPTATEEARYREILANDEVSSVIPGSVDQNARELPGSVMAMVILSVFTLLMPVITTDNFSGTNKLQFTSKTGKGIFKKQFAAYLLSAALLTVVELAVICIFLYFSPARIFFDCKLNGVVNIISGIFWFKGTLIQYLEAAAGMVAVLSLACTAAVFLISKSGKNYISLLMKGIPATLALTAFCYLCTCDMFAFATGYQYRNWYYFIPVPFIELYLAGALFIGMAAALFFVLKRQKKKEIL